MVSANDKKYPTQGSELSEVAGQGLSWEVTE